MTALQNVTFAYPNQSLEHAALKDVSLAFPSHQITLLTGPSGCGKTTCLRLLAGLDAPHSGNVTRETTSISYLFQDLSLLPWLTALENVNLVLSDRMQTHSRALDYLTLVGLREAANLYPAELSGGMKQRVALARALCTDADLLLLDEPTRGLDEALHQSILALIRELRKGKTTILVSHNELDRSIADTVLTLE